MKIVYINGFQSENSSKPEKLSKLLGIDIEHVVLKVDANGETNIKEIEKYFEENDVDFIIGSSLGGYVAHYIASMFIIPTIVLNPVIDLEVTFKDRVTPNLPLFVTEEIVPKLVLLAKDDNIIDYLPTLNKYKKNSKVVVYPYGGHRFLGSGLHKTKGDIEEFINKTGAYIPIA